MPVGTKNRKNKKLHLQCNYTLKPDQLLTGLFSNKMGIKLISQVHRNESPDLI